MDFCRQFIAVVFALLLVSLNGCADEAERDQIIVPETEMEESIQALDFDGPEVVVLGIAQDAGYPQANCRKDCCAKLWEEASAREMVSCIGIIDRDSSGRICTWMIDATPDFKDQLHALQEFSGASGIESLQRGGILLTHGHMGHYTGLMHLGREAMGAESIPVYAMPRMREYLSTSGPWSQLVNLRNIELRELDASRSIRLSESLKVTPLVVPHRDEFTETVGFVLAGSSARLLFIPDIDKWEKWELKLEDVLTEVDYALLDATFFDQDEVQRDMSEIPHPFVVESILRLQNLPESERNKIYFIHLNHSNPLLQSGSAAMNTVIEAGMYVARFGSSFSLGKAN